MAVPETVVVGSTKRDLVVTIVDSTGTPINLTGATNGNQHLIGKSSDLPSVAIDVTGTITDPTQGVITFTSIGTLVTSANLTTASINTATYRMQVKFTDAAGKFDYTAPLSIAWLQIPSLF